MYLRIRANVILYKFKLQGKFIAWLNKIIR
jgi:hypothetical protein